MNRSSRARLVAALALLGLAGCGFGGPSVTPVEGVIKINGKPAGNLLIQITPEKWSEPSKVLSASAVSDDSGRFVLKCDNGQMGATAGKHKVIVLDNNLNVEDEPGKSGARPKLPANRIPPTYASPTTTTLELVVDPAKKDYEVNVIVR